jgi:hypothetical protein
LNTETHFAFINYKKASEMFEECNIFMEEMRSTYIILVGKPDGKKPLGRPRHLWEANVRMDCKENCGLNLSSPGQGRVMGSCEHCDEPLGFIKI